MVKLYDRLFKNKRNCDILFFIGFIAIIALYLYKIPLDIQGNDEAFYLTVPKRLLDGDVFLVDEWHGSQFSAFLVYPLMWIHNLLFTSDGIVLHFRYIYLICHAAVCLVIYFRLRDKKLFAIAAALMLFLFTPYDITALSYNTMGLDLVAVTGVLLSTAQSKKVFFIAGITFAAAVLCCPYLIFVYAVFGVIALIFAMVKRNGKIAVSFLMFTLGAALLAVILFAFILSRTTLSEFLKAIPNLFTDPEHVSKPFFEGLFKYFRSIVDAFAWGKLYFGVYAVSLIIAAFDKKRYQHRTGYIAVSVVIAILMLIEFAFDASTTAYNHIMFPAVLVGLTSHIVTYKKDHRTFLFMYLGALAYTMCIFFSSNQYFYIISATSTAAGVGSIILLHRALLEEKYEKKSCLPEAAVIVMVLALLQVFLMTNTKIVHKFWSYSKNSELTSVISDGPYMGIKVTPGTEQNYNIQLAQLGALHGKQGSVLYATTKVWYYFETPDLSIGSYSAWLSGESNTTVDRLSEYYSQNPKKVPTYIYMPSGGEWDTEYFKSKIIDKYGYEFSVTEGGTLYSRV